MSDKFQDFAQKKKLKHAGDPDVSYHRSIHHHSCDVLSVCLCVDFHQGSGQTHSQSAPVPEGAEPGKLPFITNTLLEGGENKINAKQHVWGEAERFYQDKIYIVPPPISQG